MKNLVWFLLFFVFILGMVFGAVITSKILTANFPRTEISNPLISYRNGGVSVNIIFEGDVDQDDLDKVRDVGEALHLQLLPAVDKFRRDGDDTQLLILKARINGNKETEYRLMMKEKWLKGMVIPRPSDKD